MASMQEELVTANLKMALIRLINAVEELEPHEDAAENEDVVDAIMQAKQALNKAR